MWIGNPDGSFYLHRGRCLAELWEEGGAWWFRVLRETERRRFDVVAGGPRPLRALAENAALEAIKKAAPQRAAA